MTRERLDHTVTGGGSKLNNNVMYLLLFGMGGFGTASGRLGGPRRSVHLSAWRQALLGWLFYNPVITVPLARLWAGSWALALVWGELTWVGTFAVYAAGALIVGYRRARTGRTD